MMNFAPVTAESKKEVGQKKICVHGWHVYLFSLLSTQYCFVYAQCFFREMEHTSHKPGRVFNYREVGVQDSHTWV